MNNDLTELDMLGPLGRPFSALPENSVIVAGGYGCAATFLAAKNAVVKPTVIIGGRSAGDILLQSEYEMRMAGATPESARKDLSSPQESWCLTIDDFVCSGCNMPCFEER